jgi:hypothetical protein
VSTIEKFTNRSLWHGECLWQEHDACFNDALSSENSMAIAIDGRDPEQNGDNAASQEEFAAHLAALVFGPRAARSQSVASSASELWMSRVRRHETKSARS